MRTWEQPPLHLDVVDVRGRHPDEPVDAGCRGDHAVQAGMLGNQRRKDVEAVAGRHRDGRRGRLGREQRVEGRAVGRLHRAEGEIHRQIVRCPSTATEPVIPAAVSSGRMTNMIELTPPVEKAFLVAVDTGDDQGWTAQESLAEIANLATTAGAEVVGAEWQNRRHVDPNWYIGKGKAEELAGAKREVAPACSSPTTAVTRPAARARGAV